MRYKFVSPWVALGNTTQNRYKFLKNKDRIAFLNKLLGQNLVFLGREMEIDLKEKVYTRIKLASLSPKPVDEDNWGAFTGEFQTNFVLPDYIGIGNGITRGYGAIHGLFSEDDLSDKNTKSKNGSDKSFEIDECESGIKVVTVNNVPKPRRKNKKNKKAKGKKELSGKANNKHKMSKEQKPRPDKTQSKQDSDDKFNTVEYHQKQHIV